MSDENGYCPHGVYVGGIGPDWMCGPCENGDNPVTGRLSPLPTHTHRIAHSTKSVEMREQFKTHGKEA